MDVPGYSALLLRRTYADLALPEALMDRAQEWLGSTDARWHNDTKTWSFPSGATLTFGYLQTERDKYRYQGAAFSYCVAEGTAVRLGDNSYKLIEDVEVGDMVQTLEGERAVTRVWGARTSKCVKATIYDEQGLHIGTQIHPIDHKVLTPVGWLSYDDVCSLYDILGSTRFDLDHISSLPSWLQFPFVSQKPSSRFDQMQQHPEYIGLPADQSHHAGFCAFEEDDRSDSEEFDGEHPEPSQLRLLSFPVVLHAPFHPSTGCAADDCVKHDAPHEREATQDSRSHCFVYPYHDGVQSPIQRDTGLYGLPSQDDVGGHTPSCCTLDAVDNVQKHILLAQGMYAHPYTNECRNSSEDVRYGSLHLSPCGESRVYDISVDEVCHYITSSNIINKNCGFDEVTQFTETMYQYLFSRLRKLSGTDIPIRMRAASNPGDIGHDWVKRRWIAPSTLELQKLDRFFIPAFLEDNPYLDKESYTASLNKLDPVTREQLRHGDWDISIAGGMFDRTWFKIVDESPSGDQVRFWDLAATEPAKGKDPDWTVGVLMVKSRTGYCVKDVVRVQKTPGDVEELILHTARLDGIETQIYMEQEPGASGKGVIYTYAKLLAGYAFYGVPSSGKKVVRAQPFSAAVYRREVAVVNGPWLNEFLSELERFPSPNTHDDIVDTASAAYSILAIDSAIDSALPTPSSGLSRFSPH